MRRRLGFSLLGVAVLGALGSLAGCGRGFFFMEQRAAWRHDAEVSCLKSGAVKESPARVRVNPIDGPGMCGADFPLRVSAIGESSVLAYGDEIRPPGLIPRAGASQPRWPVSQPPPPPAEVYAPSPVYRESLPPTYPVQRGSDAYQPPPGSENYLRAPAQPRYAPPPAVSRAAPGEPLPLYAPGVSAPIESNTGYNYPPPSSGGSVVRSYPPDRPMYDAPPSYPASRPVTQQPLPALGPARSTPIAIRPVEVTPNATLACPIVSALDQWISGSVQPAAMRWFGQPVVEIKQISAYSCRGMNGQVGAKISEHAFGNALDIAAFTLADGRKVVVRTAWHGAPEEQGFLRDVQGAACQQFNTVLAPGSNQFHYDHIHVDLMRRASGHQICQPAAMPGEVAAARAAQQKGYARRGDPGITGSITPKRKLADIPAEDDDHQWIKENAAASVDPRPIARDRD